jgi:hypothetical protein
MVNEESYPGLKALIAAREAGIEAIWFANQRGDQVAAREYLEQVNNYAMAIQELRRIYVGR